LLGGLPRCPAPDIEPHRPNASQSRRSSLSEQSIGDAAVAVHPSRCDHSARGIVRGRARRGLHEPLLPGLSVRRPPISLIVGWETTLRTGLVAPVRATVPVSVSVVRS